MLAVIGGVGLHQLHGLTITQRISASAHPCPG